MRIACVLDSGFEDSEFKTPYDGLRAADHEVVVIGLKSGTELTGKSGDVTTRSEASFDDVRALGLLRPPDPWRLFTRPPSRRRARGALHQ